jgi:endonuclease G
LRTPLPGFQPDPLLPEGWYRVRTGDDTNSGFDRGHMTPSDDRKSTQPDNCATFFMTNIVPQAPTHNRGVWAQLEAYSRSLTADGSTLFVVAGVEGLRYTIGEANIAVPGYLWKAVLVLPPGVSDPSLAGAATAFAVSIPNVNSVGGGWQRYYNDGHNHCAPVGRAASRIST